MPTKKPLQWLVTAGFTADGGVAYMRADHSFSRRVDEAAVFDSKDAAEQARKVALTMERIVADPYLMEVVRDGDRLDLLSARERIRAQGPTVRLRRPDPKLSGSARAES